MIAHKMKEKEKDNIIMTCPTHGVETYFRIKKLERTVNMEDYVYVWFKDKEDGDEKMWVRITKGTKIKGLGKLDNVPIKMTKLKLGSIVKFKTNEEGITWAQ